MNCDTCGHKMTELFTSVVCDHCHPADGQAKAAPVSSTPFVVGQRVSFKHILEPLQAAYAGSVIKVDGELVSVLLDIDDTHRVVRADDLISYS